MIKEIVRIGHKGRVDLPLWAWNALLRKAGVRSKKHRVQKRVVKRAFTRLVREELESRINFQKKFLQKLRQ